MATSAVEHSEYVADPYLAVAFMLVIAVILGAGFVIGVFESVRVARRHSRLIRRARRMSGVTRSA